ncbi:hypothetical protein [uncultured Vagococcus sp.]|uniref:hypothetical protein n=1 Tax=uncultured Vagococcus sp. TaxID=189676 RepID=UPI0028D8FD16|nr:hypothetical protein [uncultured Vagococcus sp.]
MVVINDLLENSFYIKKNGEIISYADNFYTHKQDLVTKINNIGTLLAFLNDRHHRPLIDQLETCTTCNLEALTKTKIDSNIALTMLILFSSHYIWDGSKVKLPFLKEKYRYPDLLRENLSLINAPQSGLIERIKKEREALSHDKQTILTHTEYYKVFDTNLVDSKKRTGLLCLLYDFYFCMTNSEYYFERLVNDIFDLEYINNNGLSFNTDDFFLPNDFKREISDNHDKITVLSNLENIVFPQIAPSIVTAHELKKKNATLLSRVRTSLRSKDSYSTKQSIYTHENGNAVEKNTCYSLTRFENDLQKFLNEWQNKNQSNK